MGGKGRTALPGSPNISQPVGSVCSVNSGGVCDSCEVTCFLIVHSESCEAPFSLYRYKPHTVRWIHHKGTTHRGTGQSLLCASTNLAKMSAFTHPPHHTVTLDPLQNFHPEPRDHPHFFHALGNFCSQDPILAEIPEFPVSLPKHARARTLFWFLLLLWSSVLFQSCCHFI